jgi:hypothetical protein
MKRFVAGIILLNILLFTQAQDKCVSASYLQRQLATDPLLPKRLEQVETFTKERNNTSPFLRTAASSPVIKIPVVVHVLYRVPEENISEQKIIEQINILNRDFRKKNADTSQTPSYFRPLAADFEIEFHLAKSDPLGRSTNGIVKKYTPVKQWYSDDKMKFAAETGSNAWDTRSYLNIWICNLRDAMGYSAFPGTEASVDGIVLDYHTIGYSSSSQYNKGRTAVHEAGHWLNLKHLWGDAFCGDDNVGDTPKQSHYTPDCPSGIRISCNNGPNGNMYMNYMDFTNDACMNIFTEGQRQRARVLFDPGGARHSILSSKGLDDPVIYTGPVPDFYPQWMYAKAYPNPASNQLTVYFEYDERWVGKQLLVMDMNGRILISRKITSAIYQLDISRLNPGIYIIRAAKEDETIFQKFIKM